MPFKRFRFPEAEGTNSPSCILYRKDASAKITVLRYEYVNFDSEAAVIDYFENQDPSMRIKILDPEWVDGLQELQQWFD
jgi:hypothetical protein